MTQEKRQAAEISAAQVVAETTKASLQVYREIRDEIKTISSSQAAVYLASIGEQAALELLREINNSIRELARKIDELDKRRPTGHTDRLKLTVEQQQLLDARLRDVEVGYYQTIIHAETKERVMREDMDRHARRTTPIWRLVWDAIGEWWSSGK